MSTVMLRRALKELRGTVLWYAFGLGLYSVMVLAAYPAVHKSHAFGQYIHALPKAFLSAFRVTDMTTFPGFLGSELLNFMWPLITGIFVIMVGSSLVAGEVERGTAELWLSVPESRTRLLVAKLAALLAGVLLLPVVTLGTLVIGARLVGEVLILPSLFALGLVLLAFSIAVAGYAALFSSFCDERGRPAGMAAGLTLGFYAAGVLAGVSDRLHWFRHLSLFTAYEPQQALAQGRVQPLDLAILLLVGLACAVAACLVFARRDVII